MKVFSFATEKGDVRIGVETDEGRFNFTHAWEMFKQIKSAGKGPDFHFLQMMLELEYFDSDAFTEVLIGLKEYRSLDDLKLPDEVAFEVPIARPQKILCIGRNYRAHAEEMGKKVSSEPIFFAKWNSTLLPHRGAIVLPPNIGRVDHEVELAVIIGKAGKNISEGAAMEHVAGYTIVNDVTARDLQEKDKEAGRPWTRSKNCDTFCPIGPYIVPKTEIDDLYALTIELRVNGEVRQHSSLDKMVFRLPRLISYLSSYVTLTVGDIICTGTPEGISALSPGDLVEAEIENIGVLCNSVVSG